MWYVQLSRLVKDRIQHNLGNLGIVFFSLSFVTKGYLRCTRAVWVPKRMSYVQYRVVKIVSI